MKKVILSISLLVLAHLQLLSQVPANIKYTSSKGFSSIKKDVEFVIDSVAYDPFYQRAASNLQEYNASYIITVTQSGKTSRISVGSLPKELELKASDDNLNNYWFAKNLESLRTLNEIKDLYATRSKIETEANRYMQLLQEYNLFFDDPYLESYLYSVVSKILPEKRADGFPYDLKIKIVKDPSLNAAAYPNGILIVHTGLLAHVHTEDELAAILTHEIAHFVANHTLVNIRQMQKAQQKAEALAALTAVAGAVVAGTAAAGGNYYSNASIMKSTAVLAYAAANSYLEKIGMQYNREQEEEADKMALDALKYLGYDRYALASVFQRMADIYTDEGNWAAYYLAGDHPSLHDRIMYCGGRPSKAVDNEFEKMVSFAVTSTAISKYNDGRFKQALALVNQNIDNKVGTDDDYLIKARCLLNLYSDDEHNKEALAMVQKAKSLYSGNVNILRTEIIACLRNNDLNKASTLLDEYIKQLNESLDKVTEQGNNYHVFLTEEMEWARNMSIKVRGL